MFCGWMRILWDENFYPGLKFKVYSYLSPNLEGEVNIYLSPNLERGVEIYLSPNLKTDGTWEVGLRSWIEKEHPINNNQNLIVELRH